MEQTIQDLKNGMTDVAKEKVAVANALIEKRLNKIIPAVWKEGKERDVRGHIHYTTTSSDEDLVTLAHLRGFVRDYIRITS